MQIYYDSARHNWQNYRLDPCHGFGICSPYCSDHKQNMRESEKARDNIFIFLEVRDGLLQPFEHSICFKVEGKVES